MASEIRSTLNYLPDSTHIQWQLLCLYSLCKATSKYPEGALGFQDTSEANNGQNNPVFLGFF